MKLSKYNLYDMNNHVIYNGITKSIVKLTEDEWKSLEKQIDGKEEIMQPITTLDKNEGFYAVQDELVLIKANLKKCTYESDILMLTIVVTRKCNFRCQYCYEEFSDESISEEEEKAIYQYIVENIDSYKGVEIGWFGGEPLIEFQKIKRMTMAIAALCVKKKKTFNAGITTNGYLLDNEKFRLLLKMGVRSFHVTLDGVKEQHDITRKNTSGKGTYDTILNNLKQIWEYESNNNEKINYRFTIRINISRANMSKISDLFALLAPNIAANDKFGIQIALVENYGGEKIGKFKSNILTADKLNYFRKMALEKGIRVHDLEDLLFSKVGALCYAEINSHITVVPQRGIAKCTLKLDESEYHVGKIKKTLFIDAEKQDRWSNRKINVKCTECKYLPLCFGGSCPLKNNIMSEQGCPSHFWGNSLESLLGDVYKMKMSHEC